jgi:hypothetical protein
MESTWENRDLLVLASIVELSDDGRQHVTRQAIAERSGLDDETVHRSLWALAAEQPPFFKYVDGSTLQRRDLDRVYALTGHARRTVGAWPTPDGWADRLVAALEAAAEREPDAEKQGKLKLAASILGGIAREVIVRSASGAIVGTL